MKLFKKFLIISIVFLVSGCFRNDSLENITIYTTVYPIEYIVERLYGDHSTIKSIYPNGVDTDNYEITDTLLSEYSDTDMFIFNGLSQEQNYVKPMLNNNKNLKIIDGTNSMEYSYVTEDLWLNPNNMLAVANNIKKGFSEYITSSYLQKEINANYESLKNDLATLDAKYRKVGTNATWPYLIVSSDKFLFLQKYGLTVISLENNDNLTDKIMNEAKKLISNGKIKYVYTLEGESNSNINKIIDGTNVKILTLKTISNLSDSERKTYDYLTIMTANLDTLKEQLYD